ncbi:MAG: glutathione peroxidase [Proteobacteria bacterium]|nr:MAG: glutathione peroxidase [Pseudomonadota bacterium]
MSKRLYFVLAAILLNCGATCLLSFASQEPVPMNTSFYSLSAKTIDGELFSFSQLEGKVVLIVNTASRCGFTSQYAGLQSLYDQYQDRGLVVLGFPSNDFMGQEPGSNEDIKKFCRLNYDVSFPMFSKGPVKGEQKQEVYRYLTEQTDSSFQGEIGWNFVKFLVDRSGNVVGRFSSMTKPSNDEITEKIEAALAQNR